MGPFQPSQRSEFEQEQLTVEVSVGTVVRRLFWIICGLLFVGFIANYIIFQISPDPEAKLAKFFHRFDLGFEPSLPAFYSSLAIFLCAILLWLISRLQGPDDGPTKNQWLALSVVFFFLSIDEAIMIHEMADNLVHDALNTTGVLYLGWVIPGIAFVVVFGMASLQLLCRLEAPTRNLFVAAGLVFVSGALGMEMVASLIIESEGVQSLKHTISQTIEEGLEMFGILIFLYALLSYLSRYSGVIQLRLGK